MKRALQTLRNDKEYYSRELCDGFKERDQQKISVASLQLKEIDELILKELGKKGKKQ